MTTSSWQPNKDLEVEMAMTYQPDYTAAEHYQDQKQCENLGHLDFQSFDHDRSPTLLSAKLHSNDRKPGQIAGAQKLQAPIFCPKCNIQLHTSNSLCLNCPRFSQRRASSIDSKNEDAQKEIIESLYNKKSTYEPYNVILDPITNYNMHTKMKYGGVAASVADHDKSAVKRVVASIRPQKVRNQQLVSTSVNYSAMKPVKFEPPLEPDRDTSSMKMRRQQESLILLRKEFMCPRQTATAHAKSRVISQDCPAADNGRATQVRFETGGKSISKGLSNLNRTVSELSHNEKRK